eukprot:gnl/TRDRNA2_/TRDRNA2_169951_c1_seq3.p1 gnl/TRDRNA2_/TRDRNA2_169951_c1~~gnl/TRDRNA2_/TRDRNA2_169951_c1_seq3.p1  ORF type:complete len:123 (+),score=19.55 gnl/TRDRNA2_/TRDRNA2_169951_c1_seq3:3-371(+)
MPLRTPIRRRQPTGESSMLGGQSRQGSSRVEAGSFAMSSPSTSVETSGEEAASAERSCHGCAEVRSHFAGRLDPQDGKWYCDGCLEYLEDLRLANKVYEAARAKLQTRSTKSALFERPQVLQ